MLTQEEKQVLERIIKENPERGRLQRQLQQYVDRVLDEIIAKEKESESRT